MEGHSHGTSLPAARCGLGTHRVQSCVPAGTDAVSVFERRVAGAKRRRARRGYIEAVGGRVPASTPMWVSRPAWLAMLSAWMLLDGAQVLRARSVRPELFVAVCEALAAYADGATGRHCAVTNARIATNVGCSERTVSTVRAILREHGFAVLAQQGCGGAGRPNRVAVYHLVSRPAPVENPAVCDLPPLRSSRGSSHPRNSSPSAHTRRKSSPTPTAGGRRRAPQRPPRPLPLQRIAGELAAAMHGLDRGHIGAVCDAIRQAGIDPAAVTAAQIRGALDADMRETGWSWPDEIDRPGAFLRYRLSRISGRLDALTQASTGGGCAAAGGLDKGSSRRRPADPAVRAAAMAAIPAVGSRTRPTSASDRRAHDEPLADWERELINATETARCDLCDDDGMRGMYVCDHIDHASAAKRGMDMIRRAMGWDQRTRAVLQCRNTATVVSEHACEICGTAVEQRPSECHAPLCAACSAVMDRDAMEVSGVPVIA